MSATTEAPADAGPPVAEVPETDLERWQRKWNECLTGGPVPSAEIPDTGEPDERIRILGAFVAREQEMWRSLRDLAALAKRRAERLREAQRAARRELEVRTKGLIVVGCFARPQFQILVAPDRVGWAALELCQLDAPLRASIEARIPPEAIWRGFVILGSCKHGSDQPEDSYSLAHAGAAGKRFAMMIDDKERREQQAEAEAEQQREAARRKAEESWRREPVVLRNEIDQLRRQLAELQAQQTGPGKPAA